MKSLGPREHLFEIFRGLAVEHCPYRRPPGDNRRALREGLTAQKMNGCRWLQPELSYLR
jgi:hypothetical protein